MSQAETRVTSGPALQKTDAEDTGDKSEGDQFEDLIGTLHFHCADFIITSCSVRIIVLVVRDQFVVMFSYPLSQQLYQKQLCVK